MAAATRGDELDDRELVTRANAGDRASLDILLRRHYDRIAALCRRITGNEADGNDATQEALMAIVRGLPRFDGTAAFSTWAYRVATNASLDELRRRRRRPEPTIFTDRPTPARARGHDAEGTGEHVLADTSLAIDESVALSIDIDKALASLPADFRAAVVLRDLCGLDYAEIAAILAIPGGTVRSRIARGRACLAPLVRGNSAAIPERPTTEPAPPTGPIPRTSPSFPASP